MDAEGSQVVINRTYESGWLNDEQVVTCSLSNTQYQVARSLTIWISQADMYTMTIVFN